MVHKCRGGGAKHIMKEWSRDDAETSVTRYVKATAKEDPTASTTRRISVNAGNRITAPIEPPDQAEFMMRYMLVVRCGV